MPAVLHHLRSNTVAYLALFVALGGTSYAAVTINGSKLRNRSVAGAKIKKNALGGTEVREAKLGTVPNADKLDGIDSSAFLRSGTPTMSDGYAVTKDPVTTCSVAGCDESMTLALPPGRFAIFAKLNASISSGTSNPSCTLSAGTDTDVGGLSLVPTTVGEPHGTISMQITHESATGGTATVTCDTSESYTQGKLTAIRLGTLTRGVSP
jgi:hypothetical protein